MGETGIDMKLRMCVAGLLFLVFAFPKAVFAEEITLLFSGQTHAMLYPCHCPKEPDGGIARRAALVKEARAKFPNTLLLDAGSFFAGGLFDEYTQNTQLDIERSKINLRAMELMGYDAAAIGNDEFNFGKEFLADAIAKTKIPFVSANIEWDKIMSAGIKKVGDTKIGITAVTSMAVQQKTGGLKFHEPGLAIKKTVSELKKKGADIVILLSNLTEDENSELIKENPGIDIIVSNTRPKEPSSGTVNSVLILKPTWQGRKLGKATIFLKDKRIVDSKVEESRLSDQVADDKNILAILPRCFQDANCKKEGLIGICQNAGSINAGCGFSEAQKISLLIITPQVCRTCDPERTVQSLKRELPGLVVNYLFYPNEKADRLIRDLNIKTLPVYLLGKEIEKEKIFENFKQNLELKGDFYMVKQQVGGFGYFPNRPKIEGKVDLFMSLYTNDSLKLLDNIKEFNPDIHFLVTEQQGEFWAVMGMSDLEESMRSVCVQKYYPGYFWQYISCRTKNLGTAWWDDCLEKLDTKVIKNCARGQEAKILLRENTALNKELEIMNGPTYLLDNQEIFASVKVPSKEEFRKIILGK
jgi:hypothetical protein